MKNLGIILSTWVLLFFAVACMKQEKDVFKSAEAEGRKNGSPIILQEGGKDEIMGGSTGGTTSSSACLPPTNLVVSATSGQSAIFSWTPPSPGSSYSYLIYYYWNGTLLITTTVNSNQITLPVPQQGTYSIEIYTVCSNTLSVPLAIYNAQKPTGPGGNAVVICDNLDNCIPDPTTLSGSFTRPNTNTIVNYTYINASVFAYTNITSPKINVNLTNSTLPIPVSTTAANYYCTFIVPTNTGSNNNCLVPNDKSFDVTLTLPSPNPTSIIYYVAFKPLSPTLAPWCYVIGKSGDNVILPRLRKGISHQVRLLSQYTHCPTADAYSACSI